MAAQPEVFRPLVQVDPNTQRSSGLWAIFRCCSAGSPWHDAGAAGVPRVGLNLGRRGCWAASADCALAIGLEAQQREREVVVGQFCEWVARITVKSNSFHLSFVFLRSKF
jgi:hypothetical protein